MENKSMSFMQAVQTCFKKSFVFNGRARRSEYWWWTLFVYIVSMVDFVLDGALSHSNPFLSLFYHTCTLVFTIYIGIASTAVGMRRLHDIGRSGWWYGAAMIYAVIWILLVIIKIAYNVSGMNLDAYGDSSALSLAIVNGILDVIIIPCVPYLIYSIVLLVWSCKDSQPGTNKYGENPKGVVE